MSIEYGRFVEPHDGEYFLTKVAKKDYVIGPVFVPQEQISYTVTDEVVETLRIDPDRWPFLLPLVVSKNDLSSENQFVVTLEKEDRERGPNIDPNNHSLYPHLIIRVSKTIKREEAENSLPGREDTLGEIALEMDIYDLPSDDPRPNADIFQRRIIGKGRFEQRAHIPLGLIFSAGYETQDGQIIERHYSYALALVIHPEEGLLTHFVYTSGAGEVATSDEQEELDASPRGVDSGVPFN